MITPEPKYFVMKKAIGGTRIRVVRAAMIGRRAPWFAMSFYSWNTCNWLWERYTPSIEPIPMTKIAEILVPSRPSYSLPVSHSIVTLDVSIVAVFWIVLWDPSRFLFQDLLLVLGSDWLTRCVPPCRVPVGVRWFLLRTQEVEERLSIYLYLPWWCAIPGAPEFLQWLWFDEESKEREYSVR